MPRCRTVKQYYAVQTSQQIRLILAFSLLVFLLHSTCLLATTNHFRISIQKQERFDLTSPTYFWPDPTGHNQNNSNLGDCLLWLDRLDISNAQICYWINTWRSFTEESWFDLFQGEMTNIPVYSFHETPRNITVTPGMKHEHPMCNFSRRLVRCVKLGLT